MIDGRTQKVLMAIIKHCNIINDTKNFFGDDYSNVWIFGSYAKKKQKKIVMLILLLEQKMYLVDLK